MDITKPQPLARGVTLHFTKRMFLFSLLVNLGIAFAVVFWIPFFSIGGSFGADWYAYFRPAVQNVINGSSPYLIDGFFSPPWVLVILAPFTLLPKPLDLFALIAVNLFAILVVLRRLGASWLVSILFILTSQLWWGILFGNIDCIVSLGFILPPVAGLFFVSMKPQLGIAIAIFWVIQSWRKGNIKEVVNLGLLIGVVVLLSFVFFGWWPEYMGAATGRFWNISNWPYLLPFGLVLLVKAIREKKQNLAIAASPFLSPYLGGHSLPFAILGLLPDETDSIIAILSIWIIFLFRAVW